MKILCIPDVHLKPYMFDIADKVLSDRKADRAVQLGDLVDDWGKFADVELYDNTLERAIKFQNDHPDTIWIMGNHDYGYWKPNLGVRESGFSKFVLPVVGSLLRKLESLGGEQMVMADVDGCIFSHGGVTKSWMEQLEDGANPNFATPEQLWQEDGPLWVRPQEGGIELVDAKLQICGHTPTKTVGLEGGILSTDTFSTYPNGEPYGDRSLAIVDTEDGSWEVVYYDK